MRQAEAGLRFPSLNDRQDPPFVADEREMLAAWLDFHHATLLGEC
jgi:hypothetical protein